MANFEGISLEKGMYAVPGKSFTQVLEELDHSCLLYTLTLPTNREV